MRQCCLFLNKSFLNAFKASLRMRLLRDCADLAIPSMTFGGKLKKKCLFKDPQVVKSRRRIFAKADLKKSLYLKI